MTKKTEFIRIQDNLTRFDRLNIYHAFEGKDWYYSTPSFPFTNSTPEEVKEHYKKLLSAGDSILHKIYTDIKKMYEEELERKKPWHQQKKYGA